MATGESEIDVMVPVTVLIDGKPVDMQAFTLNIVNKLQARVDTLEKNLNERVTAIVDNVADEINALEARVIVLEAGQIHYIPYVPYPTFPGPVYGGNVWWGGGRQQ